MALPPYATLEVYLLQVIASLGGSVESKDTYEPLERFFPRLTHQDKKLLTKHGHSKWHNQVQWARSTLIKKRQLKSPGHGVWQITDAGRRRLKSEELASSDRLMRYRNQSLWDITAKTKAKANGKPKKVSVTAAVPTEPELARADEVAEVVKHIRVLIKNPILLTNDDDRDTRLMQRLIDLHSFAIRQMKSVSLSTPGGALPPWIAASSSAGPPTSTTELGEVYLKGFRCRCGHGWIPRAVSHPRTCPKCKSTNWDKP